MGALPEDTEETKDKAKETTLSGGGFLERTTKRIEEQKALAKVAGTRGWPPLKSQQNRDPSSLCHFWRRTPLQDTVAETSSTNSCTLNNIHTSSRERTKRRVGFHEQVTLTHTTNVHLMITFFPIPGWSLLPIASRLPFCLCNWHRITSDQWVIQLVKGYRLQLTSTPSQKSPPRPLETKNPHSINREIQKLVTKGAVKKVPPYGPYLKI